MDRDFLTLSIVAAIVAGNVDAVAAMMVQLALVDADWAQQLMDAMKRGNNARGSR